MKDIKLYICAGVFIILTAVRVFVPQAAESVCGGIRYVLNLEQEQTQAMIALGSSLTKDDVIKVFDYIKDSVS